MKLRCPQCDDACGLFARACPRCGLVLTVGSLARFYVTHVRRKVAIRCARCGRGAVPVGGKVCPACGEQPTFQDAMQATVDPYRQRVRHFLAHASPRAKNRVQWVYLLFSAWLLWGFQGEVANRSDWIGTAFLSVIYVAVFLVLAKWLMPRRVLRGISQRATAKVKLGLAMNCLSAVLLLQLVIAAGWARAVVQAVIFVALWGAAIVFNRYLLPVVAQTRASILGEDQFDPTLEEGRHVRVE